MRRRLQGPQDGDRNERGEARGGPEELTVVQSHVERERHEDRHEAAEGDRREAGGQAAPRGVHAAGGAVTGRFDVGSRRRRRRERDGPGRERREVLEERATSIGQVRYVASEIRAVGIARLNQLPEDVESTEMKGERYGHTAARDSYPIALDSYQLIAPSIKRLIANDSSYQAPDSSAIS